jgi:hypothetical protein
MIERDKEVSLHIMKRLHGKFLTLLTVLLFGRAGFYQDNEVGSLA